MKKDDFNKEDNKKLFAILQEINYRIAKRRCKDAR